MDYSGKSVRHNIGALVVVFAVLLFPRVGFAALSCTLQGVTMAPGQQKSVNLTFQNPDGRGYDFNWSIANYAPNFTVDPTKSTETLRIKQRSMSRETIKVTCNEPSVETPTVTLTDANTNAVLTTCKATWTCTNNCPSGGLSPLQEDATGGCQRLAFVTSANGSATRIGTLPPAGQDGSAQVRLVERFAVAGPSDLSASTVTILSLLDEAGSGGAGELIEGTGGVTLFPLTLEARAGSKPNGAIFETPSGARPVLRVQAKALDAAAGLFEFSLRLDRATVPAFPQLCAGSTNPTTNLTTTFTIDDGVNPSIVVSTVEPWRCEDLLGGDPAQPRTLRVP